MNKPLFAAFLLGASMTTTPLLAQEAATADPAVGRQVFAMQTVAEKQTVGTVVAADDTAFRIQIGERCLGLPRANFTAKDGQFESPWAKDALEGSMDAGNPADFVCGQNSAEPDSAVGKQVYAMQNVQVRQNVGTILEASADAFRIRIGSQCIGLPRANFTAKDGQYESPWTREALEGTIAAGDPAEFVCPA